jgi:hypothetical protein
MSCQCFVSDAPEPFFPATEILHNKVIKLCKMGEIRPTFYQISGLEDLTSESVTA